MSKVLKIVFVVIALIVLGLGIFFIFFGNDRNLSVYNKINDVLQYKYNLDVYGDLLGLDELGYSENTKDFGDKDYPEIYMIRQKMFEVDSTLQGGTVESGIFEYYGYAKYEAVLTEGIKYYSNYTVLAGDASKRHAGIISSYISHYRSAIANVHDKANKVKNLQNKFDTEESDVTIEELTSSYNELRNAYRDYLKKSAQLVTELRDYIVLESFDNNYSFETVAILYDSVAETIIHDMNSNIEQEINYIHDESIYVDKYYEYIALGTINYGIAEEINYLLAYSKMYYEDREDYDRIFEFTHFQKYDLVHGNNNISTSIKVGFADYAILVVGLLEI